ncbi:hypothetical protein Scep_003840 [Stephania cephalantha]|uniref:Protein N-terminal glutamine amidohydrolase n=1 Tax=Stephania cephalantha TaxID=152367 RepID=A0AAP0KRA4_9MAGN
MEQRSVATSEVLIASTVSSRSIDVSDFIHTPCYCEENVYQLCKTLSSIGVADADGSDLFVVFISNDNKKVPLWHQKASKQADGFIIWDYHVVCIQKNVEGKSSRRVWDLDSDLPFPSSLSQYISEAIQPSLQIHPEFRRFFRVVHAPLFLRFFASDRRHMKDSLGEWIAHPPTYEPIFCEDGTVHNLDVYVKFGEGDVRDIGRDLVDKIFSEKYGVVLSESQLEEFFSLIP